MEPISRLDNLDSCHVATLHEKEIGETCSANMPRIYMQMKAWWAATDMIRKQLHQISIDGRNQKEEERRRSGYFRAADQSGNGANSMK